MRAKEDGREKGSPDESKSTKGKREKRKRRDELKVLKPLEENESKVHQLLRRLKLTPKQHPP